jgi:hypothetical protein
MSDRTETSQSVNDSWPVRATEKPQGKHKVSANASGLVVEAHY